MVTEGMAATEATDPGQGTDQGTATMIWTVRMVEATDTVIEAITDVLMVITKDTPPTTRMDNGKLLQWWILL